MNNQGSSNNIVAGLALVVALAAVGACVFVVWFRPCPATPAAAPTPVVTAPAPDAPTRAPKPQLVGEVEGYLGDFTDTVTPTLGTVRTMTQAIALKDAEDPAAAKSFLAKQSDAELAGTIRATCADEKADEAGKSFELLKKDALSGTRFAETTKTLETALAEYRSACLIIKKAPTDHDVMVAFLTKYVPYLVAVRHAQESLDATLYNITFSSGTDLDWTDAFRSYLALPKV